MITTQKSQPYGVLYNFIFELNMMYDVRFYDIRCMILWFTQPAGWQGCMIIVMYRLILKKAIWRFSDSAIRQFNDSAVPQFHDSAKKKAIQPHLAAGRDSAIQRFNSSAKSQQSLSSSHSVVIQLYCIEYSLIKFHRAYTVRTPCQHRESSVSGFFLERVLF